MVVHLFVGRPCCAVMELGSNSASGVFFIVPEVTFELNQKIQSKYKNRHNS